MSIASKLASFMFVVLSFFVAPICFAANAVIDVLVVYTKGTADAYGGDPTTRINQLFQVTNQIYKDSNVNLEIRLVKTLKVDYTDNNTADTALNDITYAKVPAFAGVAAAREQAGADMVILYRPFKSVQASCGLAWMGGQGSNGDFSNVNIKKYMFAHIAINSCGDYVTAHELGHNMGLKHSRKQDGSGGTFPYALGHGVVNQFTTVMAYQTEFNVDYWTGKLYKFSNPDIVCKGLPCGVDRKDSINGADARYALNITGPQIAKFYSAASSKSSSVSSFATSSAKSSVATVTSSSKATAVSSKAIIVASSKMSVASSSSVKAVAVSSRASSTKSSLGPTNVQISSAPSSKAATVIFNKVANVAQYGGANWLNEVRRDKGLTLDQAKAIANANSKITYFFIVKGAQVSFGTKGVFRTGDTVFFTGTPWYGSAYGLADAYEKVR